DVLDELVHPERTPHSLDRDHAPTVTDRHANEPRVGTRGSFSGCSIDETSIDHHIMPPMPPMPPGMPPPMPPAPSASGASATRHSVGSTIAAIDAAFCSAARVTLAGSMMPALIRSVNSPVAAFMPIEPSAASTSHTTHEPSTPAVVAAWAREAPPEPSGPALLGRWRPGATSASHTVRAPVASSPSSDSTTLAT